MTAGAATGTALGVWCEAVASMVGSMAARVSGAQQIEVGTRALSVAIRAKGGGRRQEDEAADATLVAEARRGEPRALQAIYHRHAAAVYRRITRLVGPDPDREDLMQEAFADLFRQLDDFRGDATLATYLFRIVAHKAYDHLRRRQRRPKTLSASASYDDGIARFEEGGALAPSPEDYLRGRQELALVAQAIERLSPKKRIAYHLRVVEGLSLKEIAYQVGATVFTVAQRIRHADREIQRFVERHS